MAAMETTLTIDHVLSAFSHEARTPLAALRGAMALLTEGRGCELSDDARGLVDLAVRNVRRLESLLVSVLDSGRVARGEWPVDPIPARLERIARMAADEALEGVRTSAPQVEFDFAAELPLVPADPEGMRRVIKNLVGNALRYTPACGTVTVEGRCDETHVIITVHDTGPGVEPEDREWIFGRFQQARATSTKAGGMGLGLFLSYQITRAHGGTIACIEPLTGTGACFELRLPINPAGPTRPDTRSVVPVVRVQRRDAARMKSGEVFRVSEALRTIVPSARRFESAEEVSATLVPGPTEELEAAAAAVAQQLGGAFDVQLMFAGEALAETRVA